MATPNQLLLWKNRCKDYKLSDNNHHRCDAKYNIVPSDYFEDFTILDTAYKFEDSSTASSPSMTRRKNNQCQTSFQLQNARLTLFETDTIQKSFVNNNGVYNGITMVVNETQSNLNKATIKNKAYLSELNKIMRQYEQYVSNGGKFYFYKGRIG